MNAPHRTGALAAALHAAFSSDHRLYHLQAEGELSELMVEAWSLREELSQPWELQLSTLSTRANLDRGAMLGQRVTLLTTLADGSRHSRSGIVTTAGIEDCNHELTRYCLTVQPWIALAACTRRSQAWEDETLIDIVESVFSLYAGHAAWT